MYSLNNFKSYFNKFVTSPLSTSGEYDEKGIEYCLEKGADINTKNDKGETVFIQTCKYGSSRKLLEKILDNDEIDLYLKDNNGYDGLMCAFERNYEYYICLILGNDKFDVNFKDSEGKTFFHRLCCEYEKIMDQERKYGSKSYNRFILEDYFHNFKIIQRNVNINIQDNEGYTPLMYAILNYKDNHDIILFILEDDRIDINLKNNKGKTAMDILYYKKSDYLFKLMFKYCSNKSFTDALYLKHINFLVKNKNKCIRTGNYYF